MKSILVATLFILPKGLLQTIEQTLRTLLWEGKDQGHGGCKVVWLEVCTLLDYVNTTQLVDELVFIELFSLFSLLELSQLVSCT